MTSAPSDIGLGTMSSPALTEAYVRRYPSAHYSLRWLGERFPGFILEHLVAEQSAPLAELARLEWPSPSHSMRHQGSR